MLTTQRLAGRSITPEVNVRNPLNKGEKVHKQGIHPGFETQGRRHQKSRTGVSAQQKGFMSSNIFLKKQEVLPFWQHKDEFHMESSNMGYLFWNSCRKYFCFCLSIFRYGVNVSYCDGNYCRDEYAPTDWISLNKVMILCATIWHTSIEKHPLWINLHFGIPLWYHLGPSMCSCVERPWLLISTGIDLVVSEDQII